MTDNMKKAFELFNKAYSDIQAKVTLDASSELVKDYRKEWIRTNERALSTDEMAEVIVDGTPIDVVILRHKGVLPPKKKEVKENVEAVKKVVKAKKIVEESKQERRVEPKQEANTRFKKVVKLVALEGQFTTYTPTGVNTFKMVVDGQEITLSKEQMRDFGEDLIALSQR